MRKHNKPGVAISIAGVAAVLAVPLAAQDVLLVENDFVGITTPTPQVSLHITQDDPGLSNRVFVRLTGTTFAPQFEYQDVGAGKTWRLGANPSNAFVINETTDLAVAEMRITPNGEVFVNGTQVHPDYVFDEGYELMELSEVERFIQERGHLPGVISSEASDGKIDLSSFPLQLLEKIEELTLYVIDQEERIRALENRNGELESLLASTAN